MKGGALSYRKDGAGDGTRTHDVQLGKLDHLPFPNITFHGCVEEAGA